MHVALVISSLFLLLFLLHLLFFFFFFNDTATTEIYTLSLHDALPICAGDALVGDLLELRGRRHAADRRHQIGGGEPEIRSEEHTSELPSHSDIVCRLLLEKKKKKTTVRTTQDITKKWRPR